MPQPCTKRVINQRLKPAKPPGARQLYIVHSLLYWLICFWISRCKPSPAKPSQAVTTLGVRTSSSPHHPATMGRENQHYKERKICVSDTVRGCSEAFIATQSKSESDTFYVCGEYCPVRDKGGVETPGSCPGLYNTRNNFPERSSKGGKKGTQTKESRSSSGKRGTKFFGLMWLDVA